MMLTMLRDADSARGSTTVLEGQMAGNAAAGQAVEALFRHLMPRRARLQNCWLTKCFESVLFFKPPPQALLRSSAVGGSRMTGVGNALKRHYQLYLLDYEQANPADVTGDHCAICGGSDEVSTDWISCDMCNIWVHFGCDRRPYLGTFKDYSKSNGRNYTCPRCAETKRQRTQ